MDNGDVCRWGKLYPNHYILMSLSSILHSHLREMDIVFALDALMSFLFYYSLADSSDPGLNRSFY